jgi:phosphoribosylglycinamide formyltransferase-1
MNKKARIAVLVSGGGTNLQALIDSAASGNLPNAEIVLVLSSRADAFALERAKKAGIKTAVVSKKDFSDETGLAVALMKAIEAEKTDLVVLAGYMSILHPGVIKKYSGRMINIHPSLLPKHGGKGFYGLRVHKSVIESKDKVSGATVHFVENEIDTGEIILQRQVPVFESDDESTLAARVLEIEHIILPEAVRLLTNPYLTSK